jgi:hypothetical protein
MKTFKQFLAEDMPILQGGGRAPGYDYSRRIQVPRNIGKIGPYTVWHHEEHPEASEEAVSVHYKDKQIGVVPLAHAGTFQGKRLVQSSNPSFDTAHRGKKAKVRNLVPKVYGMIADKVAALESGDYQTDGSKSVWKRLSKMRPIRIRNVGGSTSVSHHTHKEHPKLKMEGGTFKDYSYSYRSALNAAKESNERPRSQKARRALDRNIGYLKNRLADGGIDTNKLRRMTELRHFPHPRTFGKTTDKINSQQRYNPEKHDSVVYSDAQGDAFTLVATPRGKGKKKK